MAVILLAEPGSKHWKATIKLILAMQPGEQVDFVVRSWQERLLLLELAGNVASVKIDSRQSWRLN